MTNIGKKALNDSSVHNAVADIVTQQKESFIVVLYIIIAIFYIMSSNKVFRIISICKYVFTHKLHTNPRFKCHTYFNIIIWLWMSMNTNKFW